MKTDGVSNTGENKPARPDTDGVCLNKGHQVKCVYHVIERIVILGLSCLEPGGGGI